MKLKFAAIFLTNISKAIIINNVSDTVWKRTKSSFITQSPCLLQHALKEKNAHS